jgi:phosphomannomutase
VNSSLRERVTTWIASDPDPDDRATLTALLDAGDETELERRFASPLTFGTAGLRGPEMAGPAGMNRATVRRATQGVVAWLAELGLDAARGVVVGRDARHGSERFNDEVVTLLLGAGVVVYEMPAALPTPLVPYCVRALDAVAGIMITASHNPPRDNGFKLYARDGAQIVPPDDEIVERFANSASVATLAERSVAHHHYVPAATLAAYEEHLVARFGVEASSLNITYTPLHGVGGEVMSRLLRSAGFGQVTVVAEQFGPDGSFPTLPFPNPEEPGALDWAMATAESAGSTLIIANDPDADRLGAAVRGADGWVVLGGDQIGWLLASSLLEGIVERDEVVATSIVSSTLLALMAKDAGARFATTLTGFKWIARAAGDGVLGFGYEEALGYAVDPFVSDKDGLSAGLALCALAEQLRRRGESLLARIDELEGRFGVHAASQLSIRVEGSDALERIRDAVQRLRSTPPSTLGTVAVSATIDLGVGADGLPPTDGVLLELGEIGRVIVRPSGTEAKVKAYVEVTPPRDGSLADQRRVAQRVGEEIRNAVAALLRL